MGEISRFAVDTAKSVFQVYGEDDRREIRMQKRLKRSQLMTFFARQPRSVVVLEACGSAHHWARELQKLGHEARLIPPQHVRPFVARSKNDMRDAEAIFEASLRPGIHFVPVKSIDQQCQRALHRGRDLLTRQRSQLGNSIRSMLSEIGLVAPQGVAGSASLHQLIDAGDGAIPADLLSILRRLLAQWRSLDEANQAMVETIQAAARCDERTRRCQQVPGVGPVIAHATLATMGDPKRFSSGRNFVAWLGLTPRQHSSADKVRLGHISKAGDSGLRRLLVLGAASWLRQARLRPEKASPWLRALLARRPMKVAVIAYAAKMARILWAMLRSGEDYRAPAQA